MLPNPGHRRIKVLTVSCSPDVDGGTFCEKMNDRFAFFRLIFRPEYLADFARAFPVWPVFPVQFHEA
jgi:hypothetical protein